ncbi:hypothetical protein [Singulisphaera sp. PoT]|uniref:hypothetical protein n=1 Tax=Singulisphaera sp. PoT TaxID=3411797 RepID=UPI003BF5B5AB
MDISKLQDYRKTLEAERESLFSDWPISPEVREACWRNLADALDALIALGPDGSEDDASEILRRCIERYNDLDDGFICTIEREELCDILYELGDDCGLDGGEEWVDEWRDW